MHTRIIDSNRPSKALNHPHSIQTTKIIMLGKEGFSLRFVVKFVMRMKQFQSVVRVRKGMGRADGKDIMELLMLAASWKSMLCFACEGNDSKLAIKSIDDFFLSTCNMN